MLAAWEHAKLARNIYIIETSNSNDIALIEAHFVAFGAVHTVLKAHYVVLLISG